VNTDNPIEVLSANPDSVQRGHFGRTLISGNRYGWLAAFGLMLVTVGPRPELCSKAHLDWLG
jgi:hypothetical protein